MDQSETVEERVLRMDFHSEKKSTGFYSHHLIREFIFIIFMFRFLNFFPQSTILDSVSVFLLSAQIEMIVMISDSLIFLL